MSEEQMQHLNFPIDQLYSDNGHQLIVLSCVFSVLCITVVAARFFAARTKKANLWWDDWLCLPSLVFALGLNVVNILLVKKAGVGRHIASFGPEAPMKAMMWAKIVYPELLIYAFAIPLPKLVLLLFYIRIFSKRSFKIFAYFVAAFVSAWCPAVFFTNMFQCTPIRYAWDKKLPGGGKCINTQAFYQYVAVPNVISDVILLVMPLPMIWQLQTNLKQKIALSGLFLLGSVGLIASIIRLVEFFQRDAFTDPTWNAVPLLAWTMVEVEIVLIAACLPPLRPVFVNFWHASTTFGSRFTSTLSRGSGMRSAKTQDSNISSSHRDSAAAGPKQGFVRIGETGGIRRTWELEMESMQSTSLTSSQGKDGGAKVFTDSRMLV